MKFTKTTVDAATVVMLDLEALDLLEYKLDSEDTACVFEGTRDFDFTIVNEFLDSLNEPTLRRMVRILTNMRRCIANCGHDDPAADECVGKLQLFMQGLFDGTSSNITGNLFGELYNFSAKYTTSNKVYNHAETRQMLLATSLLSALCIMVIHDFETHFTDVSEPFRVLYPVFEEAIKNCGINGAKEFVEEKRSSVSKKDDDTASWIIEGIYINDWMLRKYEPLQGIDMCVVENYTQRILSSKTYVSSKRIREMKEINEAEEQQRNNKAKVENNEAKDATSNAESDNSMRMIYTEVSDTATIVALMIKQVMLDVYGTNYEFCNEVVKCINRFIAEINDGTNMPHELDYHHPLAGAEKIVDYVYDRVRNSIDARNHGGINKYLAFNDFIKDGITDAVVTMRRLASNTYTYGEKAYLQKYTTYQTLADRLNALNIVVTRLNPDIGGVINTVINACDNIDVSQIASLVGPVQYDQYGRPVYPTYGQYYKSPFQTTGSFTQNKDSTKK